MNQSENIAHDIREMAKQAKAAARTLATLSTEAKNNVLLHMAEAIDLKRQYIQEENAKDLSAGKEKGLSAAMLDRLELSDKVIASMMEGLREVAALPDPVGAVEKMVKRPNGLMVGRMRVPLGVIGMIYESRPNVTVDAAALCLKAGNAILLRGALKPFIPIELWPRFFKKPWKVRGWQQRLFKLYLRQIGKRSISCSARKIIWI